MWHGVTSRRGGRRSGLPQSVSRGGLADHYAESPWDFDSPGGHVCCGLFGRMDLQAGRYRPVPRWGVHLISGVNRRGPQRAGLDWRTGDLAGGVTSALNQQLLG